MRVTDAEIAELAAHYDTAPNPAFTAALDEIGRHVDHHLVVLGLDPADRDHRRAMCAGLIFAHGADRRVMMMAAVMAARGAA